MSRVQRQIGPVVALLAAFVTAQATHDPPPIPDPIPGSMPTGPFTLRLQSVVSSLVFPTDVEDPGDGSGRLFVATRAGRVLVVSGGAVLPTPFLDISATTVSNAGSALSALAFHPQFAMPGSPGQRKVYTVSQEAPGTGTAHFGSPSPVAHQSVIYEWKASVADPNVVDPASRREIVRINEKNTVHNVDDLAFGPDGLFYATKGDDDLTATGVLDPTNIHGTILRIDVDDPSGNGRYTVPQDNPYVGAGGGAIPEIWAHGFRNPWRFSFDRNTGLLYAADIGEDDIEEIDVIESGRYYGWIDKEGSFAFLDFNGVTDDLSDLPPGLDAVDPIAEYDHTEGDRSITGGFVYRGSALGPLVGHYVFADYMSGRLMHVAPNEGVIRKITVDPAGAQVTARVIGLGQDAAGELLFVLTQENFNPTGRILRAISLTATPPAAPPGVPSGGASGGALVVGKLDPAGDALGVHWDTTTCLAARGYQIVHGTGVELPAALGGTYDVAGSHCQIGVTSPFVWSPSPAAPVAAGEFVWFLVVAHDGLTTEGSWGADGAGGERFGPAPGGASGQCGITAKSTASTCGQ